jgi:hypothetical protein
MINRLFGTDSVLRNAASDGGDGSSASGSAQNNPVLDAGAVQKMIDQTINGFAKRFEGNFTKQFSSITETLNGFASKFEQGSQNSSGDNGSGDGDGAGKSRNGGPALDPQVKAQLDTQNKMISKLQQQLENESKAREAAAKKAEETERHSMLRSELRKYPIKSEHMDDVFEMFVNKVSRSEDGALIAGDTTMEAFIKDRVERLTGLMAPADKSGAGSTPGQRPGSFDISQIKPGMSAETEALALAEIQKLLNNR